MIQKQICMTEHNYLKLCNQIERIHIDISSVSIDVENDKGIEQLGKISRDTYKLMVALGWAE